MSEQRPLPPDEDSNPEVLAELAEAKSSSLLSEYWYFLRRTGKWWLLPAIAILAVLGAFILLTGTAAAPFIYALF